MADSKKQINSLEFTFFLFLVVGTLILLFWLFKPFLTILFFAITLAIVFYPIHRRILKSFGNRETISALISVLLFLILILAPVILIGIMLFQEATNLYLSILNQDGFSQNLNSRILTIENYINENWSAVNLELSNILVFREYGQQAISWILQNLGSVFSGFARGIFGIFLLVLSLFYFFKDGPKLKEKIVALSPLSSNYSEIVLSKISIAIESVMRGRVFLAIIQGLFVILGFVIFSIPNPVLWGVLSAVLSVLPAVGPLFIITPAVLYAYFVMGSGFSVFGLLIWAFISILVIDNYLGSIIVERRLKIHPFLILLSILGGVSFFGPIGFILGPVSLGLFFALLDIYPSVISKNS